MADSKPAAAQGTVAFGGRSTSARANDSEPVALQGLVAFDDGFAPSTTSAPTRLLRQPPLAKLKPGLTLLQNAISEEVARAAFTFTVARPPGNERQWGTYLRLVGSDELGRLQLESRGAEPDVEELAQRIMHDFVLACGDIIRPDLRHVHGFSVWGVSGELGSETRYHLDYAEIYRRETNIIVPPLHAATVQVSPVTSDQVEGGTFGAHTAGLAHYATHGYKASKLNSGYQTGGPPTADWGNSDSGWEKAPYRFRQATLCSGELPHAADRIIKWPPHVPRVVIGINSMGFVEGPTEHALPQHSSEFRKAMRLEKLLRAAVHQKGPEEVARLLVRQRRERLRQHQALAPAGNTKGQVPGTQHASSKDAKRITDNATGTAGKASRNAEENKQNEVCLN